MRESVIRNEHSMSRLNWLYNEESYQKRLRAIKEYEKNRPFCKHDEQHSLAVARVTCIKCMEMGLSFSKELIYIAAFLHDICKIDQYLDGTPHERASEKYAAEVLAKGDFCQEEIDMVCSLISGHRFEWQTRSTMADLFFEADKESRECYCCPAVEECDWKPEFKNMEIRI